MDAKNW